MGCGDIQSLEQDQLFHVLLPTRPSLVRMDSTCCSLQYRFCISAASIFLPCISWTWDKWLKYSHFRSEVWSLLNWCTISECEPLVLLKVQNNFIRRVISKTEMDIRFSGHLVESHKDVRLDWTSRGLSFNLSLKEEPAWKLDQVAESSVWVSFGNLHRQSTQTF